jgi:V/A-type H+-transporting ATPase subunit C
VDPASADRLLARSLLRRITLAARRAPLSLAVPLAWIGARREEVRRIGVVLRGAELGLAGDVLLDLAEA